MRPNKHGRGSQEVGESTEKAQHIENVQRRPSSGHYAASLASVNFSRACAKKKYNFPIEHLRSILTYPNNTFIQVNIPNHFPSILLFTVYMRIFKKKKNIVKWSLDKFSIR
jgi:hypothetical protein